MERTQKRPAIGRDFIKLLADRATPEVMGEIIDRAIADAKAGDAKARDWLWRQRVGSRPITVDELAAREAAGIESEDELAARVEEIEKPSHSDVLEDFTLAHAETLLERAKRKARERTAAGSDPNSGD